MREGLAQRGIVREVYTLGANQDVHRLEVYYVSEAARALKRSVNTVRRWISAGLLPKPFLVDAVYRYQAYSRRELQAIADVLARHETQYSYITAANDVLADALHSAVQKSRAQLF